MKLRAKITVLLASTFLILLVVVYCTSYLLSLSGFSTIENADMKQDLGQVTDTINDNENNLSLKANDWSAWDDSYKFVQDHNQDFVDANLPYASIQDLNINFMIFIDKQGNLVKYVGLDFNDPNVGSANYQGITLPDDMKQYISLGSPLLNLPNTDSKKIGILNLSEGPLIFASRPMTKSDGTGPIEGTIIFARYLYWTKPDGKPDTSQVDALSSLTHFNVAAYGVNSGNLPPDASMALSSISEQSQVVTKVLNSKTVAGYAVLNDVNDKPAVLVRVEVPRTIYAQGLASLNYFIISLFGIGVIFGIGTLILLDRMVLSRVSRLSDALATVTVNHDYSTRLPVEGNDRLTQLALSANLLLDELQLYPQIRETVAQMRQKFYGQNAAQPAAPAGVAQTAASPTPAPVRESASPSQPLSTPLEAAPAPPAPQSDTQPPPEKPQVSTTPPHDPHDMFDPKNSPPHLPANLQPPSVDMSVPPPEPPPTPPQQPPPAPPEA